MRWMTSGFNPIFGRFLCIAGVIGIAAGASDPSAAGTKPEPSATLELREGQAGFAGVSGTIWRIAVDGTVTISSFLNDRELTPVRTGKLDAAEIGKLRAQFRAAHFDELAKALGSAPPVNPRTLSLRSGDKTVVLTLPPTDPAHPSPAASGPEERKVIDLAALVRDAAERGTRPPR